jgi:hypothetical protein
MKTNHKLEFTMSSPFLGRIAVPFTLLMGLMIGSRDAAAEFTHSVEVDLVPPLVTRHQMLTNPATDPQYRANLQSLSSRPGANLWADLKICVSQEGHVRQAKVLRSVDPAINSALTAKAMTWKYEPYKVNGKPVPYCYILRYQHAIR